MASLNSTLIKSWAAELGFSITGVAPVVPVEPQTAHALRHYLNQGWQGQMSYLANHLDKRLNPALLVPGSRSIICTATSYYHPQPIAPHHAVARFARFQDYHLTLKERLGRLRDRISHASDRPVTARCFVDSAPLLEKYHAWQAGLGWIGKNTLLLHPHFGSWLLLGEIVCDLELEPDSPMPQECGSCDSCIRACPTQALVGPGQLKACDCLSYWTVEQRGSVPEPLRELVQRRSFGCDICQEACPFNQTATISHDPEFLPRPDWNTFDPNQQLDQARTDGMTNPCYTGSSMARLVKKEQTPFQSKPSISIPHNDLAL